jgi:hypothetical protein
MKTCPTYLLIALQSTESSMHWVLFQSENTQTNVSFRAGWKRWQMQQQFLQTFDVLKWQLVLLLLWGNNVFPFK